MSNNIFFSIVVPTYNRGAIIEKTLQSLLTLDSVNYEIIVVDDGSTDDTESVVANMVNDKLRYIKKNNAERGAARNYGATLAKGDYINFFDSDDIAYPNHILEAMKAVTNLNHPEIFHLGYDVKDSDGVIIRRGDQFPATINAMLIHGNHLSCNGVFIRKDICTKFPFSENRTLSASEDFELWLRLASRFPIHCVNVITSTVINHDSRSVLTIRLQPFMDRMKTLENNLFNDDQFNATYGHQKKIFKSYVNIYIALHLAMANYSKRLSLMHLYQAFKLRPQVFFTRRFLAALKNIVL